MAYTAYFATTLTGGTSGALDAIDGTGLINNDIAIAVIGGIARVYRLDDDSAMTEASPYIITPDTNAGNKRWILQPMWGENHISGLILSNGTDADHDIDISTGSCFDSTNTTGMFLTSVRTKQIDAAWAVGNAGGLFLGTVANSTLYHLHLIKRSDTGVVDAGFDTSATAANIPANYDYYRWLGWVLTDGSANILAFKFLGTGNECRYHYAKRVTVATGPGATTFTTQSLAAVLPTSKIHSAILGGVCTITNQTATYSIDSTNAIFNLYFYETDSDTSNAAGGKAYGTWPLLGVPLIGNNVIYKLESANATKMVTFGAYFSR